MNKNKIRSIKTAAKGYAFIGINLIGVLIFWTIPLIFSFIISISKWDYSKGIKGIKLTGLSNYIEMWKDEWFRASLINNIIFTISFVLILVVLSFVVAYVLNEYVVGKKLVQLGLYLPYIVNIVAISAVWLALFSNNGPVIGLLKKVGIENPPVFIADLHWALPTIVLICVWQNLGYTVILFLSGMVNIPKDLYEAAAIDGANVLQKIRYVTIPMLSGTTFFIVITSIINSFRLTHEAGGRPLQHRHRGHTCTQSAVSHRPHTRFGGTHVALSAHRNAQHAYRPEGLGVQLQR